MNLQYPGSPPSTGPYKGELVWGALTAQPYSRVTGVPYGRHKWTNQGHWSSGSGPGCQSGSQPDHPTLGPRRNCCACPTAAPPSRLIRDGPHVLPFLGPPRTKWYVVCPANDRRAGVHSTTSLSSGSNTGLRTRQTCGRDISIWCSYAVLQCLNPQ